ncbi:MAG: iron-containing alcohol dehydrogenase [Eubacterium sp.]|nr:iron-containing alcohol dehydrogenase [Eubacterium sp.]
MDVDGDGIHIGFGVSEELDDVLRTYQNPVFICDSTTRAVAEPFLEEELKDCLVIELSPEDLAVNDACVERVLSQLEVCDLGQSSVPVDLLIAIGSGVIHDLTRFGAKEYGIPFASVPTKPDAEDARKRLTSDPVPEIIPRWVFADAQILCTEDANRSERLEMFTHALEACGIAKEFFHEKLEERDF